MVPETLEGGGSVAGAQRVNDTTVIVWFERHDRDEQQRGEAESKSQHGIKTQLSLAAAAHR